MARGAVIPPQRVAEREKRRRGRGEHTHTRKHTPRKYARRPRARTREKAQRESPLAGMGHPRSRRRRRPTRLTGRLLPPPRACPTSSGLLTGAIYPCRSFPYAFPCARAPPAYPQQRAGKTAYRAPRAPGQRPRHQRAGPDPPRDSLPALRRRGARAQSSRATGRATIGRRPPLEGADIPVGPGRSRREEAGFG